MIKKKSRIPKFKTYEEEANFWDTHEFTEFEDELEDVEIVFELNKPRDETVVLRVQREIKEQLDKLARSRGLNLSTLVRMWMMEKLQENLKRPKL
ncbi:MAG: CopG family antitoxin [Candidatus Daviesbacteria bacterium]|nr:CopG family antitoxin [Candidatus Daviesbacteria bacterium]